MIFIGSVHFENVFSATGIRILMIVFLVIMIVAMGMLLFRKWLGQKCSFVMLLMYVVFIVWVLGSVFEWWSVVVDFV